MDYLPPVLSFQTNQRIFSTWTMASGYSRMERTNPDGHSFHYLAGQITSTQPNTWQVLPSAAMVLRALILITGTVISIQDLLAGDWTRKISLRISSSFHS